MLDRQDRQRILGILYDEAVDMENLIQETIKQHCGSNKETRQHNLKIMEENREVMMKYDQLAKYILSIKKSIIACRRSH